MNYLSVENLTKSFGDRILFQDVTFGIDQGQKASIVAKNGAGKSTLLKILLGKEDKDSGNVTFRNDLRVAYMDQADNFDENLSVSDVIYNQDVPQIIAIKAYSEALRKNDDNLIADSFEAMNDTQAWEWEVEIQKVLSVLKLDEILDRKVGKLSGGQKKRISLAQVLISNSDFLILDEPTNHLDLDMIEWLESYLSASKSTILMVTHDRYFLEVICDTIFELTPDEFYRYNGNFSYYLEKKAEREEQLAASIGKAKNLMRKELEWMRRQPKARGTKQKARVGAYAGIEKKAKQRIDKDEMHFEICMERLGTKILEMHKVGKSYGDQKILNSFDYTFQRGERLGIVGKNGVGKSTFLNMLIGQEEVSSGKIVTGETVKFAYYHQDGMKIKDDKKVIDVIRDVAESIPLTGGRKITAPQFLERFMFDRKMHYNQVAKLSGGEKRRLYLMTVLMANPNFLILDEPTNDLDIFTMSVLEQYLLEFQGCIIVVSHDRYFMDKMVDHLFVFEGEGEVRDILGNYMSYRNYKKEMKLNAKSNDKIDKVDNVKVVSMNAAPAEEKKKLTYKEKKEYQELEKDIDKLETEKSELSNKLMDASLSSDEIMKISERFAEVVKSAEEKSDRWLELSEFA